MTKVYYLEDMTQEDLNKLALERNNLEKENQQLKKQKDDGIDWIKNNYCYVGKKMSLKPYSDLKDLLRKLGEKDEIRFNNK